MAFSNSVTCFPPKLSSTYGNNLSGVHTNLLFFLLQAISHCCLTKDTGVFLTSHPLVGRPLTQPLDFKTFRTFASKLNLIFQSNFPTVV